MRLLAPRVSLASCAVACMLLGTGLAPGQAATEATGGGAMRVLPFVTLGTVDSEIADLVVSPIAGDPGPRTWSLADGLRFSAGFTNTRHLVLLEVTSAQTGASEATVAVQGTVHTVADWVYAKTDSGSRFGTVRTTGTHDANVGEYTVPGGFIQDGQGEIAVRTYDAGDPEDGGTASVVAWAYDATAGRFWLDAVDKDFTNGNGEVLVAPASVKGASTYLFAVAGVPYVVSAVAGAGMGFVPTVAQAWDEHPGAAGGPDFEVFTLLDFPSGAPEERYSVVLEATVRATK